MNPIALITEYNWHKDYRVHVEQIIKHLNRNKIKYFIFNHKKYEDIIKELKLVNPQTIIFCTYNKFLFELKILAQMRNVKTIKLSIEKRLQKNTISLYKIKDFISLKIFDLIILSSSFERAWYWSKICTKKKDMLKLKISIDLRLYQNPENYKVESNISGRVMSKQEQGNFIKFLASKNENTYKLLYKKNNCEEEYDLSVLSVNYNSEELIKKNIEHIIKLNEKMKLHFIIVNNNFANNLLLNSFESKNCKITIIQGQTIGELPGRASYHHALGIEIGMQKINSKYALIIDPDFYLIRKNFLNKLIKKINNENFAIVGANWNPINWAKYGHFPTAHFFLFNTTSVPPENIDFTPDLYITHQLKLKQDLYLEKYGKLSFIRKIISLYLTYQRKNMSFDTGSRNARMYQTKRDGNLKYLIFKNHPPLNWVNEYKNIKNRSRLKYLIRRLVGLTPKVNFYVKDHPLINSVENFECIKSWESFSLDNEIIGFHVRRFEVSNKRDFSNVISVNFLLNHL